MCVITITCLCERDGDKEKRGGWERLKREGNNLFITGISRNSLSMLERIRPIRHWLESEQRHRGEREHILPYTQWWGGSVRRQRPGPAHTQRKCEVDKQTKYVADTLSGLWWPEPSYNRGRRLTHTLTHALTLTLTPPCAHKIWSIIYSHVIFNLVVDFRKVKSWGSVSLLSINSPNCWCWLWQKYNKNRSL